MMMVDSGSVRLRLRRLTMGTVVLMLTMNRVLGVQGLHGGKQRTGMDHQHGEKAKPDCRCRVPFPYHAKSPE